MSCQIRTFRDDEGVIAGFKRGDEVMDYFDLPDALGRIFRDAENGYGAEITATDGDNFMFTFKSEQEVDRVWYFLSNRWCIR